MTEAPATASPQRDPIGWISVIVGAFFLVAFHRLGTPTTPMFDEIHYLPAARRLIDLTARLNPEHPLVGKEAIALGIMLFGDTSWGWRLPNVILGAIGLFGAIRAMWWASRSRAATILFGIFFASNFVWFMIARIAMLDMAMGAFFALAVWQWVLAWQKPGRGRVHLILTGVFMGLSLGAKWNAAPLLVMPGLFFAWDRFMALKGRRLALLTARDVGPVPGVSLIEAFVWLGVLPLLVYFATFLPAFFYAQDPLTLKGLVPFQRYMLQLQDSVVKPHTYMSRWWQWVLNIRPIWFLYENVDGAQRGVLMIGNPFTMIAVLPALALCLYDGMRGGDRLRLGVALLYIFAVGFWALNGKPVQFYYHYMLASGFAAAALALVLGEWWETGLRWPAKVSVALALLAFVFFYPILSAAALPDTQSFSEYTWLKSWR